MDLKKLFQILTGKEKLNIRGKILKLVFSSVFMTLAILGLFSFVGMLITWNIVYERGESLGETASTYTKTFVKDEEKEHLKEITQVKAQQINSELKHISYNVKYIVHVLEEVLSLPQSYSPTILPNIMETNIYSGQAYVFYSPELRQNMTPEIEEEIKTVSNVARFMQTVSDIAFKQYFSEIFFGSKNGYLISVDFPPNGDKKVEFDGEFTEILIRESVLGTLSPKKKTP